MAISLTAGGIDLEFRTSELSSVTGTFPVGTAIGLSNTDLTLPGTWVMLLKTSRVLKDKVRMGANTKNAYFAIRVA